MGYLVLLKFSFKKLTALIGRDKLVAGIEKARADGDLNWAAELAAYLVSYDLENQESKKIKAEIFEALGSKTINATWRNALKIDGDISLIQKVTANVEKQNPDFEVANK